MVFHQPIIDRLTSMATNGNQDAIAAVLPMCISHPADFPLEENMTLKLYCVKYLMDRAVERQAA